MSVTGPKQSIDRTTSCWVGRVGEGRKTQGPPDPLTTLRSLRTQRQFEKIAGNEERGNSVASGASHHHSPSRSRAVPVCDPVVIVSSMDKGRASSRDSDTHSSEDWSSNKFTSGALQRGALWGPVQSTSTASVRAYDDQVSSEPWISGRQVHEATEGTSRGQASRTGGALFDHSAMVSAGDGEAEVSDGQSVHSVVSVPTSERRARRRTNIVGEGLQSSSLPYTAVVIREAIRDLEEQIGRQRDEIVSENQDTVQVAQSAKEREEDEADRQFTNLQSSVGEHLKDLEASAYRSKEYAVADQSLSGRRKDDGVTRYRLDSDISLRRPVVRPSSLTLEQLSCDGKFASGQQGNNSGSVCTYLVNGSRASSDQQSTIPMKIQSSSEVVGNQQRQSAQLRGPKDEAAGKIGTRRSELYCSSPTIDQEARGIRKADVCRCHGTLEHEIFRRDTTPEYIAGDRHRSPSPSLAPVILHNKSRRVTSESVKVEQRSHYNSPEDSVRGQRTSRMVTRDLHSPSGERQDSQQRHIGRSHRSDKPREHNTTIVKKEGHPSSPSSGNGSSDEGSGDDRGRKRDGSRRRNSRDRRRRSRSRRSRTRSSGSRSRHRISVSQKRWLKPEKFDGRSSFETFMYMFENCATYNKWSQEDKAAYLRWSLTGPAAQLLWDASEVKYEVLVEKLRGRFGGKGMEERYQTELRCRRRGKGESLRELAQDVRRLMALAYPGEKSSLADHIARDAFLSALDDPEFELKIREREPANLDTAVKIAQRYEVSRGIVDASSGSRHRVSRRVVEDGDAPTPDRSDMEVRIIALERQLQSLVSEESKPDRRESKQEVSSQFKAKDIGRDKPRSARAVNRQEQNGKEEQLLQRIAELEAARVAGQEQLVKLTAENDSLNKEVGRLKHVSQLRFDSTATPGQSVNYQSAQKMSQNPSNFQKPNGVCWSCGEAGHFARECRRRSTGMTQNRQTNQQGSVPQNASSTFRVAGAFKGTNNTRVGATYLRAKIDGREQDCLLDTGSEVSLLPAAVVSKELIRSTSSTLRAANGTRIGVLGEATVPFSTRYYESTVTGLVSDHVAEVMLGVDWLAENNASWNFQEARLRLGQHYHSLRCRQGPHRWCRRVILQEDVYIPARSQVDVPGKVVFRGRPANQDGPLWGTKPTTITKGVHVARTLTPEDKFDNLAVRVMNVQPHSCFIKSGTVISDMEPVAVVEPNPANETATVQHDQTELESRGNLETSDKEPQFVEQLIEEVDPATPESAVTGLRELLVRHHTAFSESEYDLGLTDVVVHRIDTGSAKPVRQQLRRYPPAHLDVISKHVDNMLDHGIVEPTASPWASNIVLVRKKDGTYRCCIDYRQLNSVTTKDAYPLPRIDSCLDAMAGARYFSTFDLRSSYHQVMVSNEDMDKTAFICPKGMFRYRTMPFGLCNAGATFQRLMDVVLSGLNLEICLVYLDDIVVFSSTVEDHLKRLDAVFIRLVQAGLKLKPEKCKFFQKSVSFLGHEISDRGIGTSREKIQAVVDWPTPTSIREVRAFVGLASYYRRFVQNFASIAAPLHALMKKNQRLVWGEQEQESFEKLKAALTSPPILAMPNDTGKFTLDTDASDTGIGAVLSQCQDGAERVVAYASRSLDARERNYCVTRKELLAVVHFVRHFKQYLLGRAFKVRTDHAALTWLRRTPDPVGQQARWLEQLEEYNFTVEHRSGIKHANADALSRRPCTRKQCLCHEDTETAFGRLADQSFPQEHAVAAVQREFQPDDVIDAQASTASSQESPPEESSVVTGQQWSTEGLRVAQRADPDINVIIELMEANDEQPSWETVSPLSSDVKFLWKFWPRLKIQNGVLVRRFESVDGRSEVWQVVLPQKLRDEFLALAHGGMTGGHLGQRKTAAAVQARAYWPTWSSDLSLFMRKCPQCAQYHRGTLPRQAQLQTPTVGEPWQKVSIDITGPHPRSARQNQYILTVVDHFSKWAEALPIRNHTAPTVARTLMTHVFSRFGAPLQLLSDRGPEFESELFAQLMKWMEIDKVRTTAYKPSTNGMVERFHRTLNSMLGKVIAESQRDWDEKLPMVVAAYRASPHSSTGFTPNRLFLGRENRMPLDLVMGFPFEEDTVGATIDEFVANQRQQAEAAYRVAREHLGVAAERRKAVYDARVKPDEFQVGSKVWYYYPRRYARKSPKWQRCYVGPYTVVRIIPPVNYVLQKSSRSTPFVVHADKLKRCYSPAATLDQVVRGDVPKVASTANPADAEDDEEDNLGARVHRHARPRRLPSRYRD